MPVLKCLSVRGGIVCAFSFMKCQKLQRMSYLLFLAFLFRICSRTVLFLIVKCGSGQLLDVRPEATVRLTSPAWGAQWGLRAVWVPIAGRPRWSPWGKATREVCDSSRMCFCDVCFCSVVRMGVLYWARSMCSFLLSPLFLSVSSRVLFVCVLPTALL